MFGVTDPQRSTNARFVLNSNDQGYMTIKVLLFVVCALLLCIAIILIIATVFIGIHLQEIRETSNYVHDILKEVKEFNDHIMEGLGPDFDVRQILQYALPEGNDGKGRLIQDYLEGGRSVSLMTKDVKEFGIIEYVAPMINQIALATQHEYAPTAALSFGQLLTYIAARAMDGSIDSAVSTAQETMTRTTEVLLSNTTLGILETVERITSNTLEDKDVREIIQHSKGIIGDVHEVTGRVVSATTDERMGHVSESVWKGLEYATEGERLPRMIDATQSVWSNGGTLLQQTVEMEMLRTFGNFTYTLSDLKELFKSSYAEIMHNGLTVRI